jgi:multiple sugar transport system substrate-binding protein
MRVRAVILAVVLMLVPLGARAADLVVWWDKGFYPEEDRALADLVRAFEAKSGLKIELIRHNEWETPEKIEAAIASSQPPDFLWSLLPSQGQIERWADEDRLVDLGDTIGGVTDIFDKDILDFCMLANSQTGRRGLYCLPASRSTNHIHVWLSLLEQAGFTRDDIPTEWEAFWAFWCDKVQPAVRKALGRQDIWAVGAPVSIRATDTYHSALQFIYAYTDAWPEPSGPSLLREPAARSALVKGLAAYTAIYKKSCTPPDASDWTSTGNNKAFLDQHVVMTLNETLSIPSALKATRPDDYYKNAITIDWPRDAFGRTEHIAGIFSQVELFKAGGHTAAAKDFMLFLLEGNGLSAYLMDAGDRLLPPSRKLLDQPFWLDPGDPHRMRSTIQTMTQPHVWLCYGLSIEEQVRIEDAGETSRQNDRARQEQSRQPLQGEEPARACFLNSAVNHVAVDGLTPEQAADEMIARTKQILSE